MFDLLEPMMLGMQQVVSFQGAFFLLAGVIIGICAGALPGLSPSTAVALFVPFSFTMSSSSAFIFLTAIYIASNYGGSITAILINTPGTPAAAVTAFDGYPLTLKGQAKKALGMALWASTIGGTIGVTVLILFAKPLADWALLMGPADYFALALLGLATVGSMGAKKPIHALVAAVLGLFLATVGIDNISAVPRFTFGIDELEEGIKLIPALIGLFAVSLVFEKVLDGDWSQKNVDEKAMQSGLDSKELWQNKGTVFRSSIIGTLLGVFPGAGATIASFLSYDFAKRSSKKSKTEFGKGNLEGVAASEAANSSSVGGALIPLLALGIPGSATDAVLLGAFMLQDLNPGPLLFKNSPEIPYGIFVGLLFANLAILLIGTYGNRLFLKVAKVPDMILSPLILMFAVMGSYTVNLSMVDVWFCIGFGALGLIMKRFHFPVAPVVLGLVLGDMIEDNFRRALLADGWSAFIQSKLCLFLLLITLVMVLKPILSLIRKTPGVKS